jgi:SAM-dependent methyltransferase
MARTNEYIHGYSDKEQKRLYHQAEFLETWIYEHIRYPSRAHIVEVGCGVGAQTKILLRRNPHLRVDGIDISPKQLGAARKHLASELKQKRVRFRQGDASKLPYETSAFDGAFICWFLEHVPEPVKVLKDTHRVLKPGALIYATEVMNSSLFVEPYSPALLTYWFHFNDYQWSIKGHPFVGAELGNLLLQAKFRDIQTEVKNLHFDSRDPELRRDFIQFFSDIFISAAPNLLANGRVDQKLIQEMKKELQILTSSTKSVFYYSFMQARARK